MKFKRRRLVAILLILAVFLSALGNSVFRMTAVGRSFATSPVLAGAASYSVLAGTTVTNVGPSTVSGDLGVSPGSAVTGFPPGSVGGTIHTADAHAAAAQADNTTAFGALAQPCDVTYAGIQNLTLVSPLGPGVYCADSFLLTGNLALAGSGVWIFQAASTVITSPNSSVTGGDPCNVWWRVGSSATLDTSTAFIGNILALTSISLNTGANLNGRALAQTGAVTMDTNAISLICADIPTATPTGTLTPTATPTGTLTPTATPTATPTGTLTPTATPTATLAPPTNDDEVEEPGLVKPIFLPAVRS